MSSFGSIPSILLKDIDAVASSTPKPVVKPKPALDDDYTNYNTGIERTEHLEEGSQPSNKVDQMIQAQDTQSNRSSGVSLRIRLGHEISQQTGELPIDVDAKLCGVPVDLKLNVQI
ncbi:hypothetical protein M3Y94_01102600 [Aphelenchoides besseyi]|nr:hypothetical protein M3Y94_01102600 [Aphelenchoides besseyi]